MDFGIGRPECDAVCIVKVFSSFCTFLVPINGDGNVGLTGRGLGDFRGQGSRHSISRCFRDAFCPWRSSKVTTALLVTLSAAPCGFFYSFQIQISEGSCVSEEPCAALAVSDSSEYVRALTPLPASYSLDHSFNRDREELLLLTYL